MAAHENTEPPGASDPAGSVTDLLSVADLLEKPELARLYTFVLRHGEVTIEKIKGDLGLPHSTTYEYVGRLEEMGVLERHDDDRPTTVTAEPIRLQLETEHGSVTVTPVLIEAVGRQLDDEDVRVFVERQGVPKLAAAVHYALRIENGELTQRTAASRLDVHAVEAMTVFAALEDVLDAARGYDPYLDRVTG